MNTVRSVFFLTTVLVFVSTATADSSVPGKSDKFEVTTLKDIAYNDAPNADPVKHKLDLYLPRNHKDFPVLFFVHGGAWRFGDRKTYAKLGEAFASQGIGTVIVSYRLSPKFQHPAHIQDVAKAFAWTCRNISHHGGRADQIFVCGHSAGGHLVSLLGTDPSYLQAEKRSLADIKGVISISGVYIIPPLFLSNIFGKDPEVHKQASPINHVQGKLPPFLIIYAEKDMPTLDLLAEQMARALRKNQTDVSTVKAEKRDHISIIINLVPPDNPAHQAVYNFIHKHLSSESKETSSKK